MNRIQLWEKDKTPSDISPDVLTVELGLKLASKLEQARELAVETVDFGRGRHQPFPQHHPGQVLDLHYYVLPSEIEWLVMVERPEEMNKTLSTK